MQTPAFPCSQRSQRAVILKKKKSETELTASVLKKDKKTHKRLKERFLIRRNRTKRANIWGNPLFLARYNTTENSQTNLSLSVRCQEAGGRKRARDCLDKKSCNVLEMQTAQKVRGARRPTHKKDHFAIPELNFSLQVFASLQSPTSLYPK